jgi:hypothetical protein
LRRVEREDGRWKMEGLGFPARPKALAKIVKKKSVTKS